MPRTTRRGNAELRYLASPTYPLKYFRHSTFSWIISAPKFNTITIERLDVDLGAGDSVTVYNGDKPTDPVLARYTGDGSDGPRYVLTTGAAAYVYMDTKSAEAGRGFQFSYNIGCDITIEDNSGVIQSPGYGILNYPNMVECTWTIKSTAPILLIFKNTFNLHQDSLKIYEGTDDTGTSRHFGTNRPADISAESGRLFIGFTTDAIGNDVGFYAEFSIDCENPTFTSTSRGFEIIGSVNTNFGSSFILRCSPGYYLSQEEFGQCRKLFVSSDT
ncbi:hypothetical protein LSAT2_002927 [Lamellibrachia satsuma]|nr:hypothetical protein LSAT2_002927 [Lamellibrachia satsuma]